MNRDDGTNLNEALELARTAAGERRTILLVEGASDQLALKTLARRYGRDLEAEDVTSVVIGGASNIGRFLDLLGPQGLDTKLAGLCDVRAERRFRRAIERAGFSTVGSRTDMESFGFFVCEADLEDELIRSLGVEVILEIAARQGELASFHSLQKQAAWRYREEEAQLSRWLGSKAQRKIR